MDCDSVSKIEKNNYAKDVLFMRKSIMQRMTTALCVILVCAMIAGCQSVENPAHTPFASNEYQGRNFQEVISELEDSGFTNIKTDTMVTYSLSKDGTVGQVTIDGHYTFFKNSVYEENVSVTVSYYKMLEPTPEPTEEVSYTADVDSIQNPSTEEDAIAQNLYNRGWYDRWSGVPQIREPRRICVKENKKTSSQSRIRDRKPNKTERM